MITPARSHVTTDRAAAVRVRASMKPEFRQLGAAEIMKFIRGDARVIAIEKIKPIGNTYK